MQGCAPDSRRSTDLIQAIRVPVGWGVVAAVGAGGPMYLLDPDLGASPAGSDRGSAVISTYAVRELYLLTGLATELVGSVESRRFRLVTPIPALGSGSTPSMPEWLQVPPGTRPWDS